MIHSTRLATLLVALLLIATTGCFDLQHPPSTEMTVKHLDQNWTKEQRNDFYHASQGTVMMQIAWFEALEQPEIKFVGTVNLLRDDDYLSRFGFLPDRKSKTNPYGLPVGFAVSDVVMPTDGSEKKVVGLTCAACHTGELHYNDVALRIDGGTAMIDVTKFQKALGTAFLLTAKMPGRFGRFADRVLGENASEKSKRELKKELNKALARGLKEREAIEERELYDGHDGGYGRTDALGKIGNFVFGTELEDDNLTVGNAPVRFPPLWDTPWFDWTQYNGSIEQPMVRNVGEALGVRALVNLDENSERFMQTTVNFEGLHHIEHLLAGDEPLQGLQSPKWVMSVLGEIDQTSARAGKVLYQDRCQKCHLPAMDSDEIWSAEYWVSNQAPSMKGPYNAPVEEHKYLNLKGVNIGTVGTDPGQATNFFGRYIFTGQTILPSLTKGMWEEGEWVGPNWYKDYGESSYGYDDPEKTIPVGVALQKVTVALTQRYYDEQGFTPEQREEYSGYRNPTARSPLQYRPRPLNGIWASPPYLHNGSVRTVYQLLSPLKERDTVFYVGTREYDPRELGYKSIRMPGAFRFNTHRAGNLNTGHVFDSGTGNGIIGPALRPDERLQIIEYLKTMGPAKKTKIPSDE